MATLDPKWLESARVADPTGNRRVSDSQLADYIAGRDPTFKQKLTQARQKKFTIKDDSGADIPLETALLNFEAYGSTRGNGTPAPASKPLNLDDVIDNPPQKGFITRLGESIMSVPERLQRGFGNAEVQAGHQEVSQPGRGEGFLAQIADLPGDVADIVGPSLPFIGGLLGGTAAGVAGAVTGPGAALTAVAGAGVGGAAMEGGRQNIGDLFGVNQRYGNAPPPTIGIGGEDATRILKEGAANAAGEGIGRAVTKIAGKVLSPLGKHFNAALKQTYEKYGIRPTASMVSDSPAVPLVESLSKKSLFGGKYNDALEEATSKVEGVAQKMLDDIGSTTDPTIAGNKILHGAEETKAAFLESRKKMYGIAAKILQQEKPQAIGFDQTKGILDQFITKKENAKKILGGVSLLDKLKTIRLALEPSEDQVMKGQLEKKFPYQVVADALDELGYEAQKKGLLSTGDAAMLNNLKGTMEREFLSFVEQHAPEAYKAIRAADLNASLGYQYLNGISGKIIQGLKNEPTKLVEALINPRSVDRIPKLFEMVGKENVPEVQGAFLKQILKEASDPATGLGGNRLQRVITRYGESTLAAALGKDRVAGLKELQQMATGLQAGRKVAEGSQTAFLGRLALYASSVLNPVMLGKLVLGDAAFSKILSSPAGMKWLTEGFKITPVAKEAIRAGSQAATRGVGSLFNQ